MGLLDMWRQARGAVMRKEYKDLMARIENANAPARQEFLNNINQTVDDVLNSCTAATPVRAEGVFETDDRS